jgi:NAD(P)-dependent dehydrogenase (short-subunit alcohol dehydrogenase family)
VPARGCLRFSSTHRAAIVTANAPRRAASAADVDAIIDVNVKGIIHVCRRFVLVMVAKRRGIVVNLGSGLGHRGTRVLAVPQWDASEDAGAKKRLVTITHLS